VYLRNRFCSSELGRFISRDVSWNDAMAFCKWSGRQLPTEAQWEKAARGGMDDQSYPWGDQLPSQPEFGNFFPRTCADDFETHPPLPGVAPVGSFVAGRNAYGLYDMAGNVWEWCMDVYHGKCGSRTDPTIPPKPYKEYGLRGGGWHNDNHLCVQCDYKNAALPTFAGNTVGFRTVQNTVSSQP